MILPDCVLSSRINQHWSYSGMDDAEHCLNKKHFADYPYAVEYRYNSRGFRDQEWPENFDDLQNAIWCLGDSFTVGIGAPLEHTWPYILQQRLDTRTINVSLDGGSNDWIARKAVSILKNIQPKILIIHWSYLHRREISDQEIWHKHADQSIREIYNMFKKSDWPECNSTKEFYALSPHIQQEIVPHWIKPSYTDEERRKFKIPDTAEDLKNIIDNLTKIADNNVSQSTIIHSFIPKFAEHKNTHDLQTLLDQLSKDLEIKVVKYFTNMDHARDYFHYDKITASYFVEQIISLLVNNGQ